MDPTSSLRLTFLAAHCLYLLFLTHYYVLPRMQELEQELISLQQKTNMDDGEQCRKDGKLFPLSNSCLHH